VLEGIGKYSFSRRRPSSAENSRDFEFFSSHSSFPSGHATVAFALSKSLSDDIDRTWATVGLYTIATASAYARLVDNMHWASDLVAGAAVGYFSAVLVRSKILRPHHEGPRLALTPAGLGLAWNF
jgi:membrane-associated phospholipid phosphatase